MATAYRVRASKHPYFRRYAQLLAIGKKDEEIDDARVLELKQAQLDAVINALPTGWKQSSASMVPKCRAVRFNV